jgi:hypothetical protein
LILTKACLVSLCENQVLLFILLAGGGYRDRLGQIGQCIAKKELASTNQNPRIEWRRSRRHSILGFYVLSRTCFAIAKLLEELGNAAALARFLIRSRHIP